MGAKVKKIRKHIHKKKSKELKAWSPLSAKWGTIFVLGFALTGGVIFYLSSAKEPSGNTPYIYITSPINNATISGSTVSVLANASATGGTATTVQFRLDGLDLGPADSSSPYQISWDSTRTINGPHVLSAVAKDGSGNETTSSPITVITNNRAPRGTIFQMTVAGPMETVYHYAAKGNEPAQACFSRDGADLPVRAFVNANNQVEFYGGVSAGVPYPTLQYPNRVKNVIPFFGPDLNHLDANRSARCPGDPPVPEPIFYSNIEVVPSQFNSYQWLSGTYTEDGTHVYAIVHHEFHGDDKSNYPFCYDARGRFIHLKCWYDSVNFASSTDGGRNFTQPTTPSPLNNANPQTPEPNELSQVIAPAPQKWETRCNLEHQDQCKLFGYGGGSNIIKKDGYYYAFIAAIGLSNEGIQTSCLMRTQDLANPKSWRAWDGFDANGNPTFNMPFVDPYSADAPPDAPSCKPVDYPHIERMSSSITYNTYIHKYILVGYSLIPGQGNGFFYAFSDDLIHWSQRQTFILPNPTIGNYEKNNCQGPPPIHYPSLLDPTSPTRNFETTHDQPYLYFSLYHYPDGQCADANPFNRDIVRFPLKLSASVDLKPPTASFITPSNGATVGGRFNIKATAADDGVVSSLQFKLDGANLCPELAGQPNDSTYVCNWHSNKTTNGFHSLTLVTKDEVGHTSTTNISVKVSNLKGDVNGDRHVNVFDLSLLLEHFDQEDADYDLNGDGVVNVVDLSILLLDYGR